jgi:hypothetical protein
MLNFNPTSSSNLTAFNSLLASNTGLQTNLLQSLQQTNPGNSNAYGFYNNNPHASSSNAMLISLLQTMMQCFFSMMQNYNQTPQLPTELPQTPNYPVPPEYPQDKTQVLGSAGLFGDPKFGVFTPGLSNIPNQLKGFESGLKNGQTVTLLQDKDAGGLNVKATGIQVDPNNSNSTGVGKAEFKSGSDTVTIKGNGDLLINGTKKGNINNNGLIAPIKLDNGMTVSTAQEIDGPNGETAERFVISNGEYKITAAVRKPHADANGYLDMNFEERTANAADNATGYQASVAGLTDKFGIADLLRLEPVTA